MSKHRHPIVSKVKRKLDGVVGCVGMGIVVFSSGHMSQTSSFSITSSKEHKVSSSFRLVVDHRPIINGHHHDYTFSFNSYPYLTSMSRSAITNVAEDILLLNNDDDDDREDTNVQSLSHNNPITNSQSFFHQLSKGTSEQSIIEAQTMLDSLEGNIIQKSHHASAQEGHQSLNVIHYSSMIDAWANLGNYTQSKKILDHLLIHVKKDRDSGYPIPNAHCFSGVMKSYIRNSLLLQHGSDSNEEMNKSYLSNACEDIIQAMNEYYTMYGYKELQPNTVIYNTLLQAYATEAAYILNATSTHEGWRGCVNNQHLIQTCVDKATDILQKMEYIDNKTITSSDTFPSPDVYSYCTVISILAKCGNVKSAELAEHYLHRIQDEKRYDTPSYNSVISAWASVGTRYAAQRATRLLEELEACLDQKDDSIRVTSMDGDVKNEEFGPNAISYHTAISAWVKSCSYKDVQTYKYAAMQAEDILNRQEENFCNRERFSSSTNRFQPNVIAYSSIINCWSKASTQGSLEAAHRAQELLSRMENQNIKPNIITYSTVAAAYGKSGLKEGILRANDILTQCKRMYHTSKEESIRPNAATYFAVIDGWARSDNITNAGHAAESLLSEMEEGFRNGDYSLKPDVRIYARVISAHAKSREKGSDVRAEMIIERMEEYAKTGDHMFAAAKPNVVIYNTLISNYAKRGHGTNFLKILNRMDQYSSSTRIEEDKVYPDEVTLNSVIYGLSKCNLKSKARIALKILIRLENAHKDYDSDWQIQPSIRSYNMVISACSTSYNSQDKKEVVDIALNVFSRLRMSNYVDGPDKYTYILMLKTLGRFMKSSSKVQVIQEIMKSCREDGLVDESIMKNYIMSIK